MADRMHKSAPTRRDRDDARRLQRAGTNGDTILAHINPEEARLLDALADGLLDGGGRNPTTGLLSFGMTDGESGRSGGDANPGGVGGGPAGGQTGGGIGGNTEGGQGGLDGGYGGLGYAGSANQRAAQALGDYYEQNYISGMLNNPYAPKDTWQRVWQEWNTPNPAAMRATPGRYGMPTGMGPGIVGTAASMLTGNPMGMAMGIGAAMGRASSAATQAASAEEDAGRSAHNSSGNQNGYHASVQDLDARLAGEQSGARTAELPQAPPGYATNPAGQIIPVGGQGDGRRGAADPVRNLLYDYIWRGRVGSGFGW